MPTSAQNLTTAANKMHTLCLTITTEHKEPEEQEFLRIWQIPESLETCGHCRRAAGSEPQYPATRAPG